jgi:hypothetical protein
MQCQALAEQLTITTTKVTAKAMSLMEDKMIDYSETILELKAGEKELSKLLQQRDFAGSWDKCNDLIVALIDLKFWLDKHK